MNWSRFNWAGGLVLWFIGVTMCCGSCMFMPLWLWGGGFIWGQGVLRVTKKPGVVILVCSSFPFMLCECVFLTPGFVLYCVNLRILGLCTFADLLIISFGASAYIGRGLGYFVQEVCMDTGGIRMDCSIACRTLPSSLLVFSVFSTWQWNRNPLFDCVCFGVVGLCVFELLLRGVEYFGNQGVIRMVQSLRVDTLDYRSFLGFFEWCVFHAPMWIYKCGSLKYIGYCYHVSTLFTTWFAFTLNWWDLGRCVQEVCTSHGEIRKHCSSVFRPLILFISFSFYCFLLSSSWQRNKNLYIISVSFGVSLCVLFEHLLRDGGKAMGNGDIRGQKIRWVVISFHFLYILLSTSCLCLSASLFWGGLGGNFKQLWGVYPEKRIWSIFDTLFQVCGLLLVARFFILMGSLNKGDIRLDYATDFRTLFSLVFLFLVPFSGMESLKYFLVIFLNLFYCFLVLESFESAPLGALVGHGYLGWVYFLWRGIAHGNISSLQRMELIRKDVWKLLQRSESVDVRSSSWNESYVSCRYNIYRGIVIIIRKMLILWDGWDAIIALVEVWMDLVCERIVLLQRLLHFGKISELCVFNDATFLVEVVKDHEHMLVSLITAHFLLLLVLVVPIKINILNAMVWFHKTTKWWGHFRGAIIMMEVIKGHRMIFSDLGAYNYLDYLHLIATFNVNIKSLVDWFSDKYRERIVRCWIRLWGVLKVRSCVSWSSLLRSFEMGSRHGSGSAKVYKGIIGLPSCIEGIGLRLWFDRMDYCGLKIVNWGLLVVDRWSAIWISTLR